MKKVHLAVAISISVLLSWLTLDASRADDLVSLDDPAPTATAAPAAKNSAVPAAAPAANAQSLDSLDDAPAAGAPAVAPVTNAPAGAANSGDAEVALDVGEDVFNPYTFSRNGAWAFLPIAAFILVGLHLIRVPKRKSKRKIDQARRFFRGLSGDATNSAIILPPKGDK